MLAFVEPYDPCAGRVWWEWVGEEPVTYLVDEGEDFGWKEFDEPGWNLVRAAGGFLGVAQRET